MIQTYIHLSVIVKLKERTIPNLTTEHNKTELIEAIML